MAWIQMDTDLEQKPEYTKILRLTKVSRAELTRRIFQLWCWIDTSTEDGWFVGMDEHDLSVQFDGTSPEFWKAFEDKAVQWLEFTPEGIRIPGYEKRFSQSAKKRANDAKRAANKRKSQEEDRRESHLPRQNDDEERRKCDLKKNREEKNKEEQKKPQNRAPAGAGSQKGKSKFDPTAVDLPFQSENFRKCWLDWCAHRREKRSPLTVTTTAKQLGDFAKWGESASIEAMDTAIRSGWTGVFEPKDRQGQKGHSPDDGPPSGGGAKATKEELAAHGYTLVEFDDDEL